MLREGDRDALEGLVRSRSARAGLVRIVFLAADGLPNTEIARRVGASRTTVMRGGTATGTWAWTTWLTLSVRGGPARWTMRRS